MKNLFFRLKLNFNQQNINAALVKIGLLIFTAPFFTWAQSNISQQDRENTTSLCDEALTIANDDSQYLAKLIAELENQLEQLHLADPLQNAESHLDLNNAFNFLERAFPPFIDVAHTAQSVINHQQPWSVQDYLNMRSKILAAIQNVNMPEAALVGKLHALRNLHLLHALTPFYDLQNEPEPDQQDKAQNEHGAQGQQENKPQDRLQDDPDPNYQVANKDVKSGGESAAPFYQIGISIKPKVPYLRRASFDSWDQQGRLRRTLAHVGREKSTVLETTGWMFIENPGLKNRFVLPMGYGSIPILGHHKDLIVKETFPGEYQVLSKNGQSLPSRVRIPITNDLDKVNMNAITLKILRRSSGIESSAWPDDLKNKIHEIFTSNLGALDIAGQLSAYIANSPQYLYCSSDRMSESEFFAISQQITITQNRGWPRALALAHGKLFNCDGAALLGATLLRDFFDLPTRISIVDNIKGSKLIDGVEHWVVDANDPLHAVVEVFELGQWHVFDFTPQTNSPLNASGPGDNELKPFDDNSSPADSKTPHNSPPTSPVEDDTVDQTITTDSANGSTNDSIRQDADRAGEGEFILSERVEQLLPLNRPINEELETYTDQFTQILYIWILEQFYVEKAPELWADVVSPVIKGVKREKIKQELNVRLAELVHLFRLQSQNKNLPINKWFDSGLREMNIDPNTSFNFLRGVHSFLNLLAKERHLTGQEANFFRELGQVLISMQELSSSHSAVHSYVERILKRLPGQVIRGIINKLFRGDVSKAGSPEQIEFFAALKQGDLRGLIEIGLAHRDLDLMFEQDFDTSHFRTPMPTQQVRPRSRAIVRAELPDLANLDTWIWNPEPHPNPHRAILDQLVHGRQFRVGNVRMVERVNPRSRIERKFSALFFDISGSMKGEPMRLQMAAIMAYIDKALSEQDKMGNYLHEVWLYPFDTVIHLWGNEGKEPIKIRNRAEAEYWIEKWLTQSPDATGGATNIQGCFEEWFRAVKVRYAEQKKDIFGLDRVNMVLFSDGESSVDKDIIRSELANMPGDLKVAFRFFAIGNTNNDLKHIATTQASRVRDSLVDPPITWPQQARTTSELAITENRYTNILHPITGEVIRIDFKQHGGHLHFVKGAQQLSDDSILSDESEHTYRELTGTDISAILAESNSIKLDEGSAYFDEGVIFPFTLRQQIHSLIPPLFNSSIPRENLLLLRNKISEKKTSNESKSLQGLRDFINIFEVIEGSPLPIDLHITLTYRLVENYLNTEGGLNSILIAEQIALLRVIDNVLNLK